MGGRLKKKKKKKNKEGRKDSKGREFNKKRQGGTNANLDTSIRGYHDYFK